MESTILGRRTGGVSVFGVISNAVSLAGSDIVERVSAKKKTGVFSLFFVLYG